MKALALGSSAGTVGLGDLERSFFTKFGDAGWSDGELLFDLVALRGFVPIHDGSGLTPGDPSEEDSWENLSFFRGSIGEAGSFASVFQSANLAYGSELLPRPVDSGYFADLRALAAIETSGRLAGQVASIEPVKTSQ